jgi:hypothetical protein
MKKTMVALVAILTLAGCGIQPATPTVSARVGVESLAVKKASYTELLVTDAASQQLLTAVQTYQREHKWAMTLDSLKAIASRPLASGQAYLLTGIYQGDLAVEGTAKVTTDAAGKILTVEDGSTSGVSIAKLPFKAATKADLRSLEPKLAAYLKDAWKAELEVLLRGQVLERDGATIYRLDAAVKTKTFPVAFEQMLEARVDGQGRIVALAGI